MLRYSLSNLHQQWSSLHTRQCEDFVSWQLMPCVLFVFENVLCYFVVLEIESRTSHTLSKASTIKAAFLVLGMSCVMNHTCIILDYLS